MADELKNRLRSRKRKVEENSKVIEEITDTIVKHWSRDLDRFLEEIKDLLDDKEKLSNFEVENITLRVPVYMYYLGDGVETLGIQGDSAKQLKQEMYNNAYLLAEGTIGDKSAEAESSAITEQLLEIAYVRAYKKVKIKLEMAEHVVQSARKVLQKRITEMQIHANTPDYFKEND